MPLLSPEPTWRPCTVTSHMRSVLDINLPSGSETIVQLVPGGRGPRHVGRGADQTISTCCVVAVQGARMR